MAYTKEERANYMKEYRRINREKIKTQNRLYVVKNTEIIKYKAKEYRTKTADTRSKYKKVYNSTPTGKRVKLLGIWKKRGVKGDLATFYDERYLLATNCEVCDTIFKSTKDRHLDHNHETGEIRYVLCQKCNTHDSWIKVLENNNLKS